MIDTAEQITCKDCGRPIVRAKKPVPHKREFCNGTCRKRWQRKQKEQPTSSNATIATMEAQARIAELEQRIAELEHERAVDHHLIDEYINRKRTPQDWKKTLQERLWKHGEAAGWPALSIYVPLAAGERAYRVFGLNASNELLEWASVAVRKQQS